MWGKYANNYSIISWGSRCSGDGTILNKSKWTSTDQKFLNIYTKVSTWVLLITQIFGVLYIILTRLFNLNSSNLLSNNHCL